MARVGIMGLRIIFLTVTLSILVATIWATPLNSSGQNRTKKPGKSPSTSKPHSKSGNEALSTTSGESEKSFVESEAMQGSRGAIDDRANNPKKGKTVPTQKKGKTAEAASKTTKPPKKGKTSANTSKPKKGKTVEKSHKEKNHHPAKKGKFASGKGGKNSKDSKNHKKQGNDTDGNNFSGTFSGTFSGKFNGGELNETEFKRRFGGGEFNESEFKRRFGGGESDFIAKNFGGGFRPPSDFGGEFLEGDFGREFSDFDFGNPHPPPMKKHPPSNSQEERERIEKEFGGGFSASDFGDGDGFQDHNFHNGSKRPNFSTSSFNTMSASNVDGKAQYFAASGSQYSSDQSSSWNDTDQTTERPEDDSNSSDRSKSSPSSKKPKKKMPPAADSDD